jgi:inositol-phosphate phosphatase/L-galactose 1-phosphate phosphatase/histidinol-phosphatase
LRVPQVFQDTDFLNRCLSIAAEAADAAAAVTRGYFRREIDVISKNDESPVTRADREAELAARAVFEKHFPKHGIIGEEQGVSRGDAEFIWVIDPIDGTKQFVTGNIGYGSLFALTWNGEPLLGLIDMPMKHERWAAARGLGTLFTDYRGTHKSHVRACPTLSDAMLTATAPEMFKGPKIPAFQRLSEAVRFTTWGNDCYGFGLLASGFVDLVVESSLGVYDYMALVPVIEEAGGIMTDWQGAPLTLQSDGSVIAAGDRRCLEATLSLLAESL